jgi:hypothetical protein
MANNPPPPLRIWQATRECTLLLHNLMQLWGGLLQEEARRGGGGRTGAADAPGPAARAGRGGCPPEVEVELDLAQLEGTLFLLLCSYDDALRRDAYEALRALRALHQRLQEQLAAAAARRREALGSLLAGGGGSKGELRGSGGAGRGGARHAPSASRDSIDFVRALG